MGNKNSTKTTGIDETQKVIEQPAEVIEQPAEVIEQPAVTKSFRRKETKKSCAAPEEYELCIETHAQYDNETFNQQVPNFLAMTTLICPAYEQENRVGVDIVCVLDKSGSMSGNKISLVRKAMRRLVRNLKAQDRVAFVTFDSSIRVLMPFATMDENGRDRAKALIGGLKPGTYTDLCGGLLKGIDVLQAEQAGGNEVRAILLFTDGQANRGVSDMNGILRETKSAAAFSHDPSKWTIGQVGQWLKNISFDLYVETFRRNVVDGQMLLNDLTPELLTNDLSVKQLHVNKFQREIDLLRDQVEGEGEGMGNKNKSFQVHTFGFGSDHNVNLLESLANQFDGMYYFMENEKCIIEGFAACLGGLLAIVAKDIELTFRPADGVTNFEVKKQEGKTVNMDGSITMRFGDLHAEEKKHIVISGTLPSLQAADPNFIMFAGSMVYRNCIQDCNGNEEFACVVNRSGQRGAADLEVDVANNRAISADALKKAEGYGNANDLASAREVISTAMNVIQTSPSNGEEWCVAALKDLNDAMEGLQSKRVYKQRGHQYFVQNAMCYDRERAVNCQKRYRGQAVFRTFAQTNMHAEFQRMDSEDSDGEEDVVKKTSKI